MAGALPLLQLQLLLLLLLQLQAIPAVIGYCTLELQGATLVHGICSCSAIALSYMKDHFVVRGQPRWSGALVHLGAAGTPV